MRVNTDELVAVHGDDLLVGTVYVDGRELSSAEVVAQRLENCVGVPATVDAGAYSSGVLLHTCGDTGCLRRHEDVAVLMEQIGESYQSVNYFVFVVIVELLNVVLNTFDGQTAGEGEHTGEEAVTCVDNNLLISSLTSLEDTLESLSLLFGYDSLVIYEIVTVVAGLGERIQILIQCAGSQRRCAVASEDIAVCEYGSQSVSLVQTVELVACEAEYIGCSVDIVQSLSSGSVFALYLNIDSDVLVRILGFELFAELLGKVDRLISAPYLQGCAGLDVSLDVGDGLLVVVVFDLECGCIIIVRLLFFFFFLAAGDED